MKKPLGRKSYGSIPHLPNSRLGSGDHRISDGQAKIATEKVRDGKDLIIVQEKLDGSNVAVAKLDDHRIVALGRSGYLAETSPYLQHQLFSDWVYANYDRFDQLLNEGEWISGEWLAQAHGTIYKLVHEPFVAFDLWSDDKRVCYFRFSNRVEEYGFVYPRLLSIGNEACSVEDALKRLDWETGFHGGKAPLEGCVWRVERDEQVEFLCKYVNDKKDGCYLPEMTGDKPIWNPGLENYLPPKALDRLLT